MRLASRALAALIYGAQVIVRDAAYAIGALAFACATRGSLQQAAKSLRVLTTVTLLTAVASTARAIVMDTLWARTAVKGDAHRAPCYFATEAAVCRACNPV